MNPSSKTHLTPGKTIKITHHGMCHHLCVRTIARQSDIETGDTSKSLSCRCMLTRREQVRLALINLKRKNKTSWDTHDCIKDIGQNSSPLRAVMS